MLAYITANLSTILVASALAGLVARSVRPALRDLRAGKCAGCKGCDGSCGCCKHS